MTDPGRPDTVVDRLRRSRWPGRPTIRETLYVGFGLVFVLWVVSGYDLVTRLNSVEERADAVSARFADADRRLSVIRTQVLIASLYLRDALFETNKDASDHYRARMEAARLDEAQALGAYVPVGTLDDEREGVRQLRAEIASFWETVLPALEWDAARRAAEARRWIREEVIPKRELIIRISERVEAVNRAALVQERDEVRQIYDAMRRRIWETGALALLASLVVAVVATRYAGGLEARIREQSVRDAANTRDLQRLSAKLVNAQEEERRTIARELHDEVGQALTAIKVELSIAAKHASLTDREHTAFREARRLADRALQQLRDLSQLLHPAMLDDLGLPETIAWYLNGFSARTNIRTDLVQDRMEDRLAPEVETCLYRIVQEALTNVARHAEASECRVYVQRLPHTVLLTVEDDGKGFPAERAPAGAGKRGLGLLGIEERVAGFRGSLRIETAPGKGTRLTVELPALPRERRDDVGDVPHAVGNLEAGETI
jgi:signal transduction histidine kinase